MRKKMNKCAQKLTLNVSMMLENNCIFTVWRYAYAYVIFSHNVAYWQYAYIILEENVRSHLA